MPAVCILILVAALAYGQTNPTRTSANYPVHAPLDRGFTIAADYLVHSIPTPTGTLIADDYLVIEVAFFGPPKSAIRLDQGNFTLRINHAKNALQADAPGAVANSIQYPDWTRKPGVTASAGNGDIMVGPRTPVPHFPGDPSGGQPIPGSNPSHDPNAPDKEIESPINDRIQNVSLESARPSVPTSGLIFFQFFGKTKKIKSLELIYEGPAGKAVLKLL